MENEIIIESPEYTKAKKLTMEIKANAEIMQESLYEVCRRLKEIKDEKLYKTLGYENFSNYCEDAIGFTVRQSRKYIAIADAFANEKGKSTSSFEQIGTEKLYLLAKLDEPQREEIVQSVDIESVTVKELKKEIESLKTENSLQSDNMLNLEMNYSSLEERYKKLGAENIKEKAEMTEKISQLETKGNELKSKLQEKQEELDDFRAGAKRRQDMLLDKTKSLMEQVKTLETRPVEVAVQENTEEIDRLTSENEELRKQLAEKPMIQETFSDGKSFSEMQAEFRAYLKALDDAMKHLCAFIARNEKEYDMWRYVSEIAEKIDVYVKVMRKEESECQ